LTSLAARQIEEKLAQTTLRDKSPSRGEGVHVCPSLLGCDWANIGAAIVACDEVRAWGGGGGSGRRGGEPWCRCFALI
jgi:hypothetical protein